MDNLSKRVKNWVLGFDVSRLVQLSIGNSKVLSNMMWFVKCVAIVQIVSRLPQHDPRRRDRGVGGLLCVSRDRGRYRVMRRDRAHRIAPDPASSQKEKLKVKS